MDKVHKIDENGRNNGCPLGHKCDDCNLYRPAYKTAISGEVIAEYDCTFNNITLLLSETKTRVLGVQNAVESARNESIKHQDNLLRTITEENAIISRQ